MYEPHELFQAPPADVFLWRYMDLAKLIALLDKGALYFSRADLLGDPYEGSMSRANLAFRQEAYADLPAGALEQIVDFRRSIVRWTFINCWHVNQTESAAMWAIYAAEGKGVAIRSTYDRLTESIKDEIHVHVGLVRYLDYDTDLIGEGNILLPFICKRRSFEHERELRGVIQVPPTRPEKAELDWSQEPPGGKWVSVDLGRLVEAIFVAPSAPRWFHEVVESVVSKYGRAAPVRQSDLARDPVY